MTEELQREIGRHDAEIENLQRDMAEVKKDVKTILASVNQATGGWKTLILVAGVAGSIGAAVGKLLPFWR